jgi:hypothetical protein
MQAQEISVYFLSMPGELILPLDVNRKKELVDTYRDAGRAEINNPFNDTVVLRQMTERYLLMQSGVSRTEIALLAMSNQSKIICIVNTVCAPVCDSRIHFYSTDWKLLDTGDFFSPEKTSDFFRECPDETETDLVQSCLSDISLMQYHINPADLSLEQTYNTPQYLDSETALKIKPCLRETPAIFHWTKNRYQRSDVQIEKIIR